MKRTRFQREQPQEVRYWPSVTNVERPICHSGVIRWAEAGFVPGYRICDGCDRHFLADHSENGTPVLLRVGSRRLALRKWYGSSA
jgi:hypothetical protein